MNDDQSEDRPPFRRGVVGVLVISVLATAIFVGTTAVGMSSAEAASCSAWSTKSRTYHLADGARNRDVSVRLQHKWCSGGAAYVRTQVCNHKASGKDGSVNGQLKRQDYPYWRYLVDQWRSMPSAGHCTNFPGYRAYHGNRYSAVARYDYQTGYRVVIETQWYYS